jgi:hypothetical protein
LITLPYALIAWAAWSSLMMNRMFGRSAARAGRANTAAATRTATRIAWRCMSEVLR